MIPIDTKLPNKVLQPSAGSAVLKHQPLPFPRRLNAGVRCFSHYGITIIGKENKMLPLLLVSIAAGWGLSRITAKARMILAILIIRFLWFLQRRVYGRANVVVPFVGVAIGLLL